MASSNQLYHYFLIVRLQPKADTGEPEAVVEWRFPQGELPKAENSLMSMITQFCFPDKEKFPKHNLSNKSKKFTFVVTNVEGTKRFGYCKRYLSGQITLGDRGKRWPVCHCILSTFPSHSIFDQILETTTRLDASQVQELMNQLKSHSVPQPGDAIYATISAGDPTAPRLEPLRFTRPEDDQSLSGFADFKALLTSLDPFTIATVLISLLLERRVIFISKKLSTLSSCVQACVALLYPFCWQHVFIPVLPLGMIQFVCAPVPFVVGLLASHLEDLQAQAELMDEVLLIDVEGSCTVPPALDFKLVPEKFLLPLVSSIAKARKTVLEESKKSDKSTVGDKLKQLFNTPGDRSSMAPGARTTLALAEFYKEPSQTDTVAKMMENAFISFFAETMGHYGNYMTPTSFNKEGYFKHDPTLEPFLRGVGGSQLFEQFIVQRQIAASRVQRGRFESMRQHVETSVAVVADVNRPCGSIENSKSNTINQTTRANLTADPKLADLIIREGWLAKFGKGIKGTAWARWKEGKDHRGNVHEGSVGTFQSRYWRLTYSNLTYHKTEDSKAAGTLSLHDITELNIIEFRGTTDCLELKTGDRTYQLHSDNPSETLYWMELLKWRIDMIKPEEIIQKPAFLVKPATQPPTPPHSNKMNGGNAQNSQNRLNSQNTQNSQSHSPRPSNDPLPAVPSSDVPQSHNAQIKPQRLSAQEAEQKFQSKTAVSQYMTAWKDRVRENQQQSKNPPLPPARPRHITDAQPPAHPVGHQSSTANQPWSKSASSQKLPAPSGQFRAVASAEIPRPPHGSTAAQNASSSTTERKESIGNRTRSSALATPPAPVPQVHTSGSTAPQNASSSHAPAASAKGRSLLATSQPTGVYLPKQPGTKPLPASQSARAFTLRRVQSEPEEAPAMETQTTKGLNLSPPKRRQLPVPPVKRTDQGTNNTTSSNLATSSSTALNRSLPPVPSSNPGPSSKTPPKPPPRHF